MLRVTNKSRWALHKSIDARECEEINIFYLVISIYFLSYAQERNKITNKEWSVILCAERAAEEALKKNDELILLYIK